VHARAGGENISGMTRISILLAIATVAGCGEKTGDNAAGAPVPAGMNATLDAAMPSGSIDTGTATAPLDAAMSGQAIDGAGPGMGRDAGMSPAAMDAAPAVGGTYAVVAGWPALEPGLVLGQVSGLTMEPGGTLLVFSRADRPWSGGTMREPITRPTLIRLDPATGSVRERFGQERFAIPHGLHADKDGNLWVTDAGLHKVWKLSPAGAVLLELGTGSPGTDTRSFNQPTDVWVGADGSVFISDGYGNSRVVKLSPGGQFVMTWGTPGAGPGQFRTPHSITGDSQGRIYVADRGNSRVQRFDAEGRFIDQWRSAQLGRPWAVSVARDGLVYVVDGGDQNPQPPDRAGVVKLDQEGRILQRWSEFGLAAGQLCWGHDVAVDEPGNVYTAEVYTGQRVQKFTRSTTGSAD
jgi:peptidylamidoglycolate lyase